MLDVTQHPLWCWRSQDLLRPRRFAFISGTYRQGHGRGLMHPSGKDRYDNFRLEWVQGVPILVTPSVFNPKVPRTGAFLAAQLDSRVLRADAEVLDMGTGSGVCALLAARHARRVVAVDINAAAIRCARINALLNHVDHRIEVCGTAISSYQSARRPIRSHPVQSTISAWAAAGRSRPRVALAGRRGTLRRRSS